MPAEVRAQAARSFRMWLNDIHHPGVRFKQVHPEEPIFSARVGLQYRALCLIEGEVATWFWIGSHAEYDKLVKSL